MTSARQDAWTADEDQFLAETVLAHIRGESTQLKAFEEAGAKLARTAAACGFRWNSYVRKKYNSEINLAKKQRKESLKDRQKGVHLVPKQNEKRREKSHVMKIDLRDVISFLESLEDSHIVLRNHKDQHEALKSENEQLTKDLARVRTSYEEKKRKYDHLKAEYDSLLSIMERARKMAAYQS